MAIRSKAVKKHMTQLKAMGKKLTKMTGDVNDLVINSVTLLWGEGNGQIDIINNTMSTIGSMKGIDLQALVKYYKECVPYTFNNETGLFTNKNKQKEAKLSLTWVDYIAENNWYDLSNVSQTKPFVLDITQLITMIDKRLEKGEKEGNQVTDEKLDLLATGLSEVLSKHTKGDVVETDTLDKDIEEEFKLQAVG